MTFQAYVLRWYKMRSPFRADGTLARHAALHPSTWLHDEYTIRKHFLPAFGPMCLDEIDVMRINEFRRSLVDSGLAGKSVTTIMGLLHKAFADALEENLIDENPVRRIASRRQIRLQGTLSVINIGTQTVVDDIHITGTVSLPVVPITPDSQFAYVANTCGSAPQQPRHLTGHACRPTSR